MAHLYTNATQNSEYVCWNQANGGVLSKGDFVQRPRSEVFCIMLQFCIIRAGPRSSENNALFGDVYNSKVAYFATILLVLHFKLITLDIE